MEDCALLNLMCSDRVFLNFKYVSCNSKHFNACGPDSTVRLSR